MNRAARRRQGLSGHKAKQPTNNTKIINEGVNRAIRAREDSLIEQTTENNIAAMAKVLHEEFGLGKARIKKFLEAYNAIFDGIVAGTLTIEGIRQQARDLGIRLEDK